MTEPRRAKRVAAFKRGEIERWNEAVCAERVEAARAAALREVAEKVERLETALRDAYVMLPPDRIALLRPWTQALMGDLTCIRDNPDHASAEDKGECEDCRTGEETHA